MTYSLSVQLDTSESPSVFGTEPSEISEHPYCEDDRCLTQCGSDMADTSADHNYCTFSSDSQPVVATLVEGLHSLADQLSSQPQSCSQHLETILQLLTCIHQHVKGDLKEKDAAETVLSLLNAEDWTKDCVYSSHLLTCVGRWLGQQFHAANSSISQKVEGFKVQHIERISDLPPAEELTTELFPEAMQMLLLHWMGLCEESKLEKRHSEYPILLLILEFANRNLITGVAHVLYSSLICK